jgi:hypothetical protein
LQFLDDNFAGLLPINCSIPDGVIAQFRAELREIIRTQFTKDEGYVSCSKDCY